MTIFSWLLVGHLVGDWLLQNDWMAKGKKQGLVTAAGMTHFVIYTASVTVCLWLAAGGQGYSATLFVISTLVIFISHWLTDATDIVETWIKFFQQTDILMVKIMVDQCFHILVLVLIAALIFGA